MGLFDRRWQAESSAVILVQGSSRSFAYPSSQHARCRHAKRLPSLSSLTSPALLPQRSVHLLCLALASLLAAIPSSALSSNPDARAELHGVLLGASDRLKLGLVSETQVSSGNRGEERSSDYSGGGEWREWVVRALLAVMAWISWSELPVYLWTATTTSISLTTRLNDRYKLSSKLAEGCRSAVGGRESDVSLP